jgi:hypothetical protein
MHEDAAIRGAHFKRRIWDGCIWAWVVCLVGFLISFGLLAGFIPPPGESWSAERIADFYAADRTAIRAGLIGAMFASALMVPFYTVVSAEIRKIEGEPALLAPILFACAVILVCFFQIICLGWLLASFRPEISPEITRALNDYGWLVWTILIPTYSAQYLCMAIAGFVDTRPNPIWPRWAAYTNLWVAVGGAGGILAVFFKTGPFSWNGLFGYWIPVVLFAVGTTMTMVLMLRRSRYEARVAASHEAPDAVRAPAQGDVPAAAPAAR